jgi:alcohol dehydrogenase (NADP+)
VAGNAGPEVAPPLAVTWRCMERLVDAGLARALGVSNFSSRKLEALLASARCKPVSVLQAEAHPYWPNTALVAACAKHGVHFTAYSTLGSRGAAGVPGGHAKGGRELLESPLLAEVARCAHRTVPQVLLRWALQVRPSCSALFKSEQPAHIADNVQLLGWRLCDANAEAVSAARLTECQRRYCSGDIFLNDQGPYRSLRDLWADDGTGEDEAHAAKSAAQHTPPTPTQARRATPP